MKIRLILISCLLSILPLLIFQVYYYYSTEKLTAENSDRANIIELKNTSQNISEKVESAVNNVSLFSQLSLPKVSLEFNRPEAMNDFLETSTKKSRVFERLVVFDNEMNFFASSDASFFSLVHENTEYKKIISLLMGKSNEVISIQEKKNGFSFFVGAIIYNNESMRIGYLIGKLDNSYVLADLNRLRSRLISFEGEKISLNLVNTKTFFPNTKNCMPVHFSDSASQIKICLNKRTSNFYLFVQKNLGILLVTILILALVYALVYKFFIDRVLEPLNDFLNGLNKITEGDFSKQLENSPFHEINSLIRSSNNIVDRLEKYQIDEIEKVKSAAIGKIATQAAHDIRSPLEVLKGLNSELSLLSEPSKRRLQMIINRIEEISFNLLSSHKQLNVMEKDGKSNDLLSLLVETIEEKKIEYRLKDVEIRSDFNQNSYGLFSKINSGILRRILSNIVNNSVESLPPINGVVSISALHEGKWGVIIISDNGVGISEEVRKKIFNKGFTTKENGNGLGLYHANEEILLAGGKIELLSIENKGTTVKIFLPLSEPSLTFTKSLDLYLFKKVIVLDDDPTFLDFWRGLLESYQGEIEFFDSVEVFLSKNSKIDESTLLLSDYELMSDSFDGIDLIQKMDRPENSILVTARNEDFRIQSRCASSKIRLLPKSLVKYVPLNHIRPSVILIDDDKLIHYSWIVHFKNKGIDVKCYFSIQDFLLNSHLHNRNSQIYIDSHLGHDIKGEKESRRLFDLGFYNLFLSTGYRAEDVQKPHWILKIYSKNPAEVI